MSHPKLMRSTATCRSRFACWRPGHCFGSALIIGTCLLLFASCRKAPPTTNSATASPPAIPAAVVGASMAPHLNGAHFRFICARCDFAFCIDAESIPRDQLATCPNCAFDHNPMETSDLVPGLDVEVVPVELPSETTQEPLHNQLEKKLPRWSITAWKHPLESDAATIKRLMAYPYESVAIRRGDVFVDGQRLRKTWPQQLAMVIDVHRIIDATRLEPFPELQRTRRWHAEAGWSQHGTRWMIDQQLAANASPAMLTFTHYRTAPTFTPLQTPVPVEDNDAFNQATARNLNPTGDLLLLVKVERHQAQTLQVALHNGEHWVQCLLDFQQRRARVVVSETDLVWERPLPELPATRSWQLGVSTIDHQATLVIDDSVVICEPLPDDLAAWHPIDSPIRIESNPASQLALDDLYVGRDTYYLSPNGTAEDWSAPSSLKPSFFVLGDNAPVSRDSRHWTEASLSPADLIGVVRIPVGVSTSHITE